MLPLPFALHYIKGMKRPLILSFVSYIVLIIFIQGAFLYSYQVQQNEKNFAINNLSGDSFVYLGFFGQTSSVRSEILNTVEAFSSSFSPEKIEWIGFEIGMSVYFASQFWNVYLFDDILMHLLFSINCNETEILISKQSALLRNLSINQSVSLFGLNYTISSYLTFEQFTKLDSFTKGKTSYQSLRVHQLLLENAIIINIDSIKSSYFNTTVQGGVVNIKYSADIFENTNPSRALKLSKKMDNLISEQLWRFTLVGSTQFIDFRLSDDLIDIQEEVNMVLSYYLLLSLPLITAGLIFFIINLRAMSNIWRKHLIKLWYKGFSRRKTYFLLLYIFLIIDFLSLTLIIAILFIEALVMGMIIDLSFLTLVISLLLILLLVVFIQLREIHIICYPKEEFLSLSVTKEKDFQKRIDYLDKKSKFSLKKFVTICVLLAIGTLLINYTSILFWLKKNFSLDSFFFMYGSDELSIYRISSTTSLIGFVIIIFSLFWLVLGIMHKFREKISFYILGGKKTNDKSKLFLSVFKINLSRRKNLGLVLFILFLSFSFSWLVINSYVEEKMEQYKSREIFGLGDICITTSALDNIPNLNDSLTKILNLPEVDNYTYVYWGETFILSNGRMEKIFLRVFDPSIFPKFLEETASYGLFEFQNQEEIFKAMNDNPHNFVIDSSTFAQLSLNLNSSIRIVGAIGSHSFSINGSIAGVSKFDVTQPRRITYPYILVPQQAFSFPIDLNLSKFIYIKIRHDVDKEYFLKKIYNNFLIPIRFVSIASEQDPYNFNKSINYMQISSFLIILLITIPLIIDVFYSNIHALSKLYSRGFELKRVLRTLIIQIYLFWINYSVLGVVISLIIFAILRKTVPSLNYGYYYSMQYNFPTILIIIFSTIASLIIVSIIIRLVIHVPRFREKVVDYLVVTDYTDDF